MRVRIVESERGYVAWLGGEVIGEAAVTPHSCDLIAYQPGKAPRLTSEGLWLETVLIEQDVPMSEAERCADRWLRDKRAHNRAYAEMRTDQEFSDLWVSVDLGGEVAA